MGKMKEIKFDNQPIDEDIEEFLDDDYHYEKWKKKQLKKKKAALDAENEDEFEI